MLTYSICKFLIKKYHKKNECNHSNTRNENKIENKLINKYYNACEFYQNDNTTIKCNTIKNKLKLSTKQAA